MTSISAHLVARTATRVLREHEERESPRDSRPLSSWRGEAAYVLLGEPGSGKTTSFRAEAQALGDEALYLTARNFLVKTLTPAERVKVLFIDALDERLIASAEPTGPFDKIRMKLAELGSPRYRISCREAEWLAGGAEDLQSAISGVTVRELALDPLTDAQVIEILSSFGTERVADPQLFVAQAERHGVDHLMRNPLLIDLLVSAVRGNKWPKTREETYGLACERLAQEQNPEHRQQFRTRSNSSEILNISGRIFAALLLSGQATISLEAEGSSGDNVSIDTVASRLTIKTDVLSQCMSSKLFVAEGSFRTARHRTIAEFLGAKALTNLAVSDGVPLPRLLALMLGYDGHVIDPLRGLYAWLTVHDLRDRQLLLDRDPLAIVLYGDVQRFSVIEKTRLLEALHREAQRYQWLRSDNATERPFGNLGTSDMIEVFRDWLASESRDPAHQSTLDFVIDAIHHGDDFTDLLGTLEQIVRDGSYGSRLRVAALEAWMAKPGFDVARAIAVLEDVRTGSVLDPDDQVAGALLALLYPRHLQPAAALRLLRPRKNSSFIGDFHMFWALSFLDATPLHLVAEVADLLAVRAGRREVLDDEDSADQVFDQFRELLVKSVAKAIVIAGDDSSVDRLHTWLNACLGKYRSLQPSDEVLVIRAWLEMRPDTMALLYKTAVVHTEADREGNRRFGGVDLVLMHAALPPDWYSRLLTFARDADSAEEAARYVTEAAEAACEPDSRFTVTLNDIGLWVTDNSARWPEASQWVESATSWPLNSNQSHEYKYRRESSRRQAVERSKRQRDFAPKLATIGTVQADPRLLSQVATTYWAERNNRLEGVSTEDRIADFLVASSVEAKSAMQGVLASLDRDDVPSVKEIFDLQVQGRLYYLSHVCQLAAQLRFEADPESIVALDVGILQKLVAFHVLQGSPGDRAWFKALCKQRSREVAEVLLPFLEEELRTKAHPNFESIYAFRSADGPMALTRICVPRLLAVFPYDTSDRTKLHLLDSVLLRGGRMSLDVLIFRELVEGQIKASASVLSQISMQVALLPFDSERHSAELINLCTTPDTARHLANAMREQCSLDESFVASNIRAAARLARLFMRSTEYRGHFGSHEDSGMSEAAEILLRQLSNLTSTDASAELSDMRETAQSASWRPHLDWRLFEHSKLARAARFSAPSFAAACAVVANGPPANHRDLAELLRHHLAHVAERIQHDEANLLETFYRQTSKGEEPKIENDCRDVLLGLVSDRITQQGASLDKEAHTSGDRRADLRGALVLSDRMAIPIEVKKDNHSEVWTAWRDQLHARYTAHPAAGGIGIYLVLWFGAKTKPSPDGKKPRTAQEMAHMLDSMIPAEFRQTTIGLVIDLSRGVRR